MMPGQHAPFDVALREMSAKADGKKGETVECEPLHHMTGKIHNGTPGKWRSFPLIIRLQRLGVNSKSGSGWYMPY